MSLQNASHIENSFLGIKKSILKQRKKRSSTLPEIPREKAQVHLGGENVISVCVLGSSNVGKTSIVRRMMGHAFPAQYIPTVYESYVKHTSIRGNDVIIDLQDMSGGFNFPAMEKRAVDNANIILIVFGLDNFETCQHAVNVSVGFEEKGCRTPIIIIGNKSDLFMGNLENRTKIEEFIANSVRRRYIEMSAKYDRYADNLLKQIYEEYEISRGPYRVTTAKRGTLKKMLMKPRSLTAS